MNAPLTEHANPNATPNPSKAPWYFLNLQELLLHMDAGLAGVIVPTLALVALAAIPYFDRSPLGVGILGTSAKGRKIAGFSAIWTTVVLTIYIVADEVIGDKRSGWGIGNKIINWTEAHRRLVRRLGSIHWTFNVCSGIRRQDCSDDRHGHLDRDADRGSQGHLPADAARIDHCPVHRLLPAYWVLAIFGTSFRGHGQDLTGRGTCRSITRMMPMIIAIRPKEREDDIRSPHRGGSAGSQALAHLTRAQRQDPAAVPKKLGRRSFVRNAALGGVVLNRGC